MTGAGIFATDCWAMAGAALMSSAARSARFIVRRLGRDGGQVTNPGRLNLTICRLEQPHLLALGRTEQVGPQRELRLHQAIALAGDLEARAKHVGPRPLPTHAG